MDAHFDSDLKTVIAEKLDQYMKENSESLNQDYLYMEKVAGVNEVEVACRELKTKIVAGIYNLV